MNRRLFFALNATDPLAESFQPTLKKLRINADKHEMVVKWVHGDNYHVTVSFLGNVHEDQIPTLQRLLDEVCKVHKPFDLKVEDVSAFASEHEARVLYLGVQNKRYLGELKDALETALTEQKFLIKPEQRTFVPHLTFARLKNPQSVKDMLSPFKRKSFGKLHVNEVILYESKLQGVFPTYLPLFRSQLLGTDEMV